MSKVFVYCIFALLSCQIKDSTFKNLDFNSICFSFDSQCYWQSSYVVRSKFRLIKTIDSETDFYLQMENSNNGVGYLEQAHILDSISEESIFKFSAQIKTENLHGKGAGLTIGIYDKKNMLIESVDMGYADFNYVKNTTDWQMKTIDAIIPKEAKIIKIGLISYGTGNAFFDNAKVDFLEIRKRNPSILAKSYIDIAGDYIMKHSLFKQNIDLKAIKDKAYSIAGNAQAGEDCYLAIRYMLQSINDKHAFLIPANVRTKWEYSDDDTSAKQLLNYSKAELKESYGYISVPGFHGNDSIMKQSFSDTLQNQIRKLNKSEIQGWIVDLRANDGGNMHPMLAGLEPLFSSDTLGFLIDVNNKKEYWGRGHSFKISHSKDYVKSKFKTTIKKNLPIAILYGSATGSSGEILIISFIGNANTRSFGQASYGLTTGNGEYKLPDGSYMLFSTSYMGDRNGMIYKSKIKPNVLVENIDKTVDVELNAAIKWLKGQH